MLAHGEQKVTPAMQRCKMLVMTSQSNHNQTVNFFKTNKYFGAQESSFIFFPQDMLPQVNKSGKIMLSSKDHIKMGPNGNGGFFAAAAKNKKVQDVLESTEYV